MTRSWDEHPPRAAGAPQCLVDYTWMRTPTSVEGKCAGCGVGVVLLLFWGGGDGRCGTTTPLNCNLPGSGPGPETSSDNSIERLAGSGGVS